MYEYNAYRFYTRDCIVLVLEIRMICQHRSFIKCVRILDIVTNVDIVF